jgi:tRNA pseudouridine38-40 synthase
MEAQAMTQRTIRLLVEYDGTHFHGFQRQTGRRTVQGAIEDALARLLGEPTAVAGAGRTDAGVHASGQVVSFTTTASLPLAKLVRGVGAVVGADLGVQAAQEVPADFHARHSALWRQYRYRLLVRPQPSPLRLGRAHWPGPAPLDLAAMQRVWSAFVGRHDFRFWENSNSPSTYPFCTVSEAVMVPVEDEWHLWLKADRFLYRMVRNLVGTTLRVGKGELSEGDLAGMFERQTDVRRSVAVPASGLYFEAAGYALTWDGATTGGAPAAD